MHRLWDSGFERLVHLLPRALFSLTTSHPQPSVSSPWAEGYGQATQTRVPFREAALAVLSRCRRTDLIRDLLIFALHKG